MQNSLLGLAHAWVAFVQSPTSSRAAQIPTNNRRTRLGLSRKIYVHPQRRTRRPIEIWRAQDRDARVITANLNPAFPLRDYQKESLFRFIFYITDYPERIRPTQSAFTVEVGRCHAFVAWACSSATPTSRDGKDLSEHGWVFVFARKQTLLYTGVELKSSLPLGVFDGQVDSFDPSRHQLKGIVSPGKHFRKAIKERGQAINGSG